MTATLFDFAARYPQSPGVKSADDTTHDAAAKVAPSVNAMRARVLMMLKRSGPMTADELAGAMSLRPGSIRPRCSELRRMGLISATGERRANRDGNRMIVWGAA